MTGFPKPPSTNRTSAPKTGLGPVETPPPPKPVTTPVMETPSGRLTENETEMILRTSLIPEHHSDPNVLRFISSYLRCRDAAQSAKEAGLHGHAGHALRNRPDIYLAITRLTEKSVSKYGFDASEIIEKTKEVMGIDLVEFENPDGTFKTHMRDIAPESRRAIKKFKAKNFYELDPNGMRVLAGQIIEVELWDKMKAIEFLGREKDLFKETRKVEHDVTANMASVLLDAGRRADQRVSEMIDVTPPAKQLSEPGTGDE